MALPLNEALLLAMWLAGLVSSAIAVYSVATYRLSARPVVALRTSRDASGADHMGAGHSRSVGSAGHRADIRGAS